MSNSKKARKPVAEWHRLTEVDEEERTATCSQCGPGVRVHRASSGRKYWFCAPPPVPMEDRRVRQTTRHYKLWHSYRITEVEWDEKFMQQGGRCMVCGTNDPGTKGWSTDHDHACCPGRRSCGKCIRDILCSRCNVGVGMLLEDPEILASAIEYLIRWNCEKC